MAEAFLSTKTGQFSYFSKQLGEPVWPGKQVLDFGGNIGNILCDPNSTIDEERYWCLDVVRDAIEKGRILHPKSHWFFYNRYCYSFNPQGIPELPVPDLGQNFDLILAFSVFTNTKPTEMFQLVPQLESSLTNEGVLAFTFIDPNHWSTGEYNGSNFQWRLEAEKQRGNLSDTEKHDLLRRAQFADWFMLVNGRDLYVETEDIERHDSEEEKTCYVFHTARYMKSRFPHAAILPPVNNEMQHCCVIRKSQPRKL
jgi:hypothetical protein